MLLLFYKIDSSKVDTVFFVRRRSENHYMYGILDMLGL